MDNTRRTWSDMERDCLVEIFMRLNLDDLILAVPFVCKSWLDAVHHPLCWKKLDFRQLDLLPWNSFSKTFAFHHSLPHFSFTYFLKLTVGHSFNSVTELRLPLKSTSIDDIVFVSNECPKLKSIALPILSADDEMLVSELVCGWKDLERLELESRPCNFQELAKNAGRHCSKLSELAVSGEIREEDASAIAASLPKLKKLDLRDSYLPKGALFSILNGCKHLEELIVSGCVGFHEDDKEIKAKASGIRDFKCGGSKLFSEDPYAYKDWSQELWLNGYVF